MGYKKGVTCPKGILTDVFVCVFSFSFKAPGASMSQTSTHSHVRTHLALLNCSRSPEKRRVMSYPLKANEFLKVHQAVRCY